MSWSPTPALPSRSCLPHNSEQDSDQMFDIHSKGTFFIAPGVLRYIRRQTEKSSTYLNLWDDWRNLRGTIPAAQGSP
jgi:hypothetical protein